MALQYTFTSTHGVTASSAYHKIYKIVYNANDSNKATAYIAMKTQTQLKDVRGRKISIDYTHRDVRDV